MTDWYVRKYLHTHTHTHTHLHTNMHTFAHTHAHTQTHIRIRTHTDTLTRIYILVYVRTCTRTYVKILSWDLSLFNEKEVWVSLKRPLRLLCTFVTRCIATAAAFYGLHLSKCVQAYKCVYAHAYKHIQAYIHAFLTCVVFTCILFPARVRSRKCTETCRAADRAQHRHTAAGGHQRRSKGGAQRGTVRKSQQGGRGQVHGLKT